MFCSSDLDSAVDVGRVFGFELELSSHEFEFSSLGSFIGELKGGVGGCYKKYVYSNRRKEAGREALRNKIDPSGVWT